MRLSGSGGVTALPSFTMTDIARLHEDLHLDGELTTTARNKLLTAVENSLSEDVAERSHAESRGSDKREQAVMGMADVRAMLE